MALSAGTLFAVNGTVSKVILESGLSSLRLTEVRCAGALAGLGLILSLCSAVTFAGYLLFAERAVGRRDPISLLCYGFLFASVFWAIAQPWWSFPFEVPGRTVSLLGNLSHVHLPIWTLMAWMVVLGTIVPFFLIVGSMQHITATRAGILAMVEPVVASVVAYGWLDEPLGATQLVGGALGLSGIV